MDPNAESGPHSNPLPKGEGTEQRADHDASVDHDGDSLARLAMQALQEAVDKVVEEARQKDGILVVWEDGAVRHIRARDLPPRKPPSP
jgi:hypothetical protein